MTQFIIRSANHDDCAGMMNVHVRAIMAIDESAYNQAVKESWAHGLKPEGYAQSMDEGEEFEVAIDCDGILSAFCGVKNGEVVGLYVDPDAQSAGLGSELLLRGEMRAEKQRPGRLLLPLCATLTAQQFYQRRGYEILKYAQRQTRGGLMMGVVEMQKIISL